MQCCISLNPLKKQLILISFYLQVNCSSKGHALRLSPVLHFLFPWRVVVWRFASSSFRPSFFLQASSTAYFYEGQPFGFICWYDMCYIWPNACLTLGRSVVWTFVSADVQLLLQLILKASEIRVQPSDVFVHLERKTHVSLIIIPRTKRMQISAQIYSV